MKSSTARNELRAWHLQGAGRQLLQAELAQMDEVLQNLFGYHLLQVGRPHDEDLLVSSRISHRIVLDNDLGRGDCSATVLRSALDELPIASDSIDVVVLPHTLEFEEDPHRVLREVERVLIAEGHVVLLGLNPWGLWGMARWMRRRQGILPWSGRFLGLMRVKDWLALLGFDIILTRQYFFRPPLQQEGLMGKLMFMEKIGARLWPRLSGAYLVVAKKRVTTLTPIKPRWKPRRGLLPAPAKPCAPYMDVQVSLEAGCRKRPPYMDDGSCGILCFRSSLRPPHLGILPGVQVSQEGRSRHPASGDTSASMHVAGCRKRPRTRSQRLNAESDHHA